MNTIVELFGHPVAKPRENWAEIVQQQRCPFYEGICYKVRKSDPGISIGTCTVLHGRLAEPMIICPVRLTERHQIFFDCLHLLTMHEPGNELHVIPEVSIPGGHVDYFLVSARDGKVKDFVAIELQTLDTTGAVWPERQRLLRGLGVGPNDGAEASGRRYGINWKMTAKTTLVQMLHKIDTFEHLNKKLVLVIQNNLLAYMKRGFSFSHLRNPAALGDSMHLHAYRLETKSDHSLGISLETRLSTDAEGVERCLGLQVEAKIELEQIVTALQARLSTETRLALA